MPKRITAEQINAEPNITISFVGKLFMIQAMDLTIRMFKVKISVAVSAPYFSLVVVDKT